MCIGGVVREKSRDCRGYRVYLRRRVVYFLVLYFLFDRLIVIGVDLSNQGISWIRVTVCV